MSVQRPQYVEIPTLYDDTHRGEWGSDYKISSMGNLTNLLGYLEHFDPAQTDGSIGICVAGGKGNFISKKLYDSIPEAHRPPLDTSHSRTVPFTVLGSSTMSLGSVIMPLILTNADTNTKFRIKLYALVLPNLLLDMFISNPKWIKSEYWGGGEIVRTCEFRDGEIVKVVTRM